MSTMPLVGPRAAQPLSFSEGPVDGTSIANLLHSSRPKLWCDFEPRLRRTLHSAASAPDSIDQPARAFLWLNATAPASAPSDASESTDTFSIALQSAEQACRARSRLLAAASHDLRQPLQTIGLWVELLREQTREKEVRTILGKIQETARGAERVLNTLLDITKLDLGIIGVNVADFAVADLLEHIAVTFGPLARDHHLALRVRNSSAIARSDPVLLERILFNFVGNAIRYSSQGGVLVGCRRHEAYLSFEVWDTGSGIPQDRLEDIFQEFVQLGTEGRDRNRGALGLGLSIAQRTAALLGHPIRVASSLGKGSCFRVDVPLGEQPRPGLTALGSDDNAAAIVGSFIVFVEDEKEQREAMELLLRNWGCHVVAAASAKEAIEQLRDHLRLPNVLLVDYRLENNETGLQAIRAIRSAIGEDVPASIISGECASFVDTTIGDLGVSVVRKPISPAQLRRHLAAMLVRANSRLV
jgi:two-component system, sensor histidine kinase